MRKLYTVIGLVLCILLPFSAISQEESVKKEKKKKEKKEVNPNFKHKFTTFHLEARADFEYDYDLSRRSFIQDPVTQQNYGFRGDYFNFLLGGEVGDHISYFIRQRIIPVKGYKELFDNTDFLYIQYKFNDQWSIRMGKDALYVGGFEYDAPPIDVYYYTHYWGEFACFHIGASAAYTDKSGKNKIVFQVANSPYVKYSPYVDYYNGNTWKSGLLSYNLYWAGNFGPFHTLYSVNFMEYQRGKFVNYIALGNQLKFNKWSIYVDWINRAAGFKNFFKDFSLVSRLDWHVSPSVNLFAKGGYEQNTAGYYFTIGEDSHVNVDMMMPNACVYYFYGLGMEYRPRIYPDLRVHAYVANSTMSNSPEYVGNAWKDMNLTANVGVTWWLNFMKFLPEKLKN